MLGEHAVYTRRGESDSALSPNDAVPTRIRFVLDVSASMYRFRRIRYCMEIALMVSDKFKLYALLTCTDHDGSCSIQR
jgi:hypothetical protein